MLKTNPDPGALVIWNIKLKNVSHHFVSAFAANDPKSTLQIWNLLEHRMENKSTAIFLNTRADRVYRTKQLLGLVIDHIKPDLLIVRGDNLEKEINSLTDDGNIEIKLFPESIQPSEIIDYFSSLDENFINQSDRFSPNENAL